MFGIGFGEMAFIAVLILIAVGPDKLPAMVKTVARTYRQLRRTAQDLRASTGIDDFLRDEELKELAELRKKKLADLTAKKVVAAAVAPIAKEAVAGAATGSGSGAATGAGAGAATGSGAGAATGSGSAAGSVETSASAAVEFPPQGVDLAEAARVLAKTGNP